MEIQISPIFKLHIDTETQLMKLSALIQTLGFVLEELDTEGAKASKSDASAISFANRYSMYGEMLFLSLGGLQECKTALERLHDTESKLISVKK